MLLGAATFALNILRIYDVRTSLESDLELLARLATLPGMAICRSAGLHPVSDGYVGYYPLGLLVAQFGINAAFWTAFCLFTASIWRACRPTT